MVVAETEEVVSMNHAPVEQIHMAFAAVEDFVDLEREEYLRNIGQQIQEVAADWASADGIEQMVVMIQRIEIEEAFADIEQAESLNYIVVVGAAVVDTEKSVVMLECTIAERLLGQVIVDIVVEGADYC